MGPTGVKEDWSNAEAKNLIHMEMFVIGILAQKKQGLSAGNWTAQQGCQCWWILILSKSPLNQLLKVDISYPKMEWESNHFTRVSKIILYVTGIRCLCMATICRKLREVR